MGKSTIKRPLFKTKKWSVTITAQSTWYGYFQKDVTLANYTPIGIIRREPDQLKQSLNAIYLNGNTITIGLANVDLTNIPAGTYNIVVLYQAL